MAVALATVFAILTYRLSSFPGLHGDEAWVGLRALELKAKGMFTLREMNDYTGSLFPEIVSGSFSNLSPSVFSLRLPGALLNWCSLLVVAFALRKRGCAGFYFTMLMGSSFLFMFYSRVAWEVCALQNFLLSLIVLSLLGILRSDEAPRSWVVLFFLAFSLGSWSHEIFLAAGLSFAAAGSLLALKWPTELSARLVLLGFLNLTLQIVLSVRRFVDDGPFVSHALPALLAGSATIIAFCFVYGRAERAFCEILTRIITRAFVVRSRNRVAAAVIGASLLISPASKAAFFGTVSGAIMLARVPSYAPGPIETIGLDARMILLMVAFLASLSGRIFHAELTRRDSLTVFLAFWTITFFPALALAKSGLADRYYIIPQFLFFCTVACAVDEASDRWRPLARALLIGSFAYGGITVVREAGRPDGRPPFETFSYGPYADTSRHFMRLDRLEDYFKQHGLCHVAPADFFIEQPVRFLMASGRWTCGNPDPVKIRYCSDCSDGIEWLELKP